MLLCTVLSCVTLIVWQAALTELFRHYLSLVWFCKNSVIAWFMIKLTLMPHYKKLTLMPHYKVLILIFNFFCVHVYNMPSISLQRRYYWFYSSYFCYAPSYLQCPLEAVGEDVPGGWSRWWPPEHGGAGDDYASGDRPQRGQDQGCHGQQGRQTSSIPGQKMCAMFICIYRLWLIGETRCVAYTLSGIDKGYDLICRKVLSLCWRLHREYGHL